jgi:murein DD-endopeptidase MepM/ murein hydrolase activator NlpD
LTAWLEAAFSQNGRSMVRASRWSVAALAFVGGRVAALALIASAPLASEPAAACPQSQTAHGAPSPPQVGKPSAELKFDWPVHGLTVIECWTEDKEKITIAARDGAEVRAAQSGVVVFAGEYRGYGNLALIRHEGGFVSAYYGDVGPFRVSRHDSVETGQAIASMRAPEDEMAELRFVLRRGSTTIDVRPHMSSPEPPREDGGDSLLAR